MKMRPGSFLSGSRAVALAGALVCLGASAAEAQFFNWWDSSLPPEQIERMVQASGYRLTGPVVRRGAVYLADVLGRRNDAERLIISAQDGRLLQRFPSAPARRQAVAATPPPNPQQPSGSFFSWFTGDDEEDAPRPPTNVYGGSDGQTLRVAPVAPPAQAPTSREIARQDDSAPRVILAPTFEPNSTSNAPLLEKPRVRPQQARRRRVEPTPVALPATGPGAKPAMIQPAAISNGPAPTASATVTQPGLVVETKAVRATVPPAAPASKAPAAKPALNDVPVAPLQ